MIGIVRYPPEHPGCKSVSQTVRRVIVLSWGKSASHVLFGVLNPSLNTRTSSLIYYFLITTTSDFM